MDTVQLKRDNRLNGISPVDYINGLMGLYNYKDSTGMAFFKNGLVLKIPNFFDYFQEQWLTYEKILKSGTEEERKEFLSENSGGIISNGSLTISLKDVVVMIKNEEDTEDSFFNND